MTFSLEEFVFNQIYALILGVIKHKLNTSIDSFFVERRVKRHIENVVADVAESIVPFLIQENVSEEKIVRLLNTCIEELSPLVLDSSDLFKGSLDGQKIYENLYCDKDFPEVIIEDGVSETYSLLMPRIATLLCEIPAAVNNWEKEAWRENYRRLDEIAGQLKLLFIKVDELATDKNIVVDKTLIHLKRMLIQKIGIQMDITGLRADQPYSGKFDDFFVIPNISTKLQENQLAEKVLTNLDENLLCLCSKNNLSIVSGVPGAGKSTWSKWLQRETLKPDWKGIGIRVEFRNLETKKLPTIYDLIRQVAGNQIQEDLTQEKIRKWLDELLILLILDGFDEVKPCERKEYIDWIKEIQDFIKGCPIIITSRPLTTDHLDNISESWEKWEIDPFTNKKIISYIDKWYRNSPLLLDSDKDINSEKLGLSWVNDPIIGPLTRNPLLLSTLLMVHHLDGRLPNGRANLYKRYINGMLGFWDERNKRFGTDINLRTEDKWKIIRGMALHLFLLEQETIDEDSILIWLEDFLPTIGIKESSLDVLLLLSERTGLIVGPGIYNFAHKSIAEFLVAETVFQGDQIDRDGKTINSLYLFDQRNNDRWNTVTFLWSGIASIEDLDLFISEAISCRSYVIAYGLLYDQYTRFTIEKRKKLLQNIDKYINKSNREPSYFHMVGSAGPINEENERGFLYEVEIPYRAIRSLSNEHKSLFDLIRKAVLDEVIFWHDVSHYNGFAYDFMWSVFVITSSTVEELSIVLKGHMPKSHMARNRLREHWGKLIAGSLSKRCFASTEELLNLIKIYIDYFPDYEGYLPFVFMNYFILEIFSNNGQKEEMINAQIIFNVFVDHISKIEMCKMKPYLNGTFAWKSYFVNAEEDNFINLPYDLLEKSFSSIGKLIDMGRIVVENTELEILKAYFEKIKIERMA